MVYVYYDPNDQFDQRFGIFLINDDNVICAYKASTSDYNNHWHTFPCVLSPFEYDTDGTHVSAMDNFQLLLTFPTEEAYNEWASQDHPEFQI